MRKVVLVTGHSSGIGRATCKLLKEEGYTVIGLSRTLYEKNVDLSLEVDVSSKEQLDEAVGTVVEKYQYIDVLVNNAGIFPLTKFEETSEYTYNEVMAVNMDAPYWLTRYALPHMRKGSQIINIASISGMKAEPEAIEYGMSKAALISFTKSLAKYLDGKIRVNSISPGFTKTNLVPGTTPKELVESIPLKREAEPKEIAEAVLFLIKNEYVNGSNLVVDAGVSL